jgi:hypothetical protein
MIYESNLYYYKIENNEDEKKVVYHFCKFHFGEDIEGEEREEVLHKNEETVESPIYFISFAE